jgi:hypothetical protein
MHLAPNIRLCLRKDHRPTTPVTSVILEFSAVYLLPTPPLRRLDHAADSDAPVTSPAAVVVPALVRIFALRVPWVSWFPSVANTFLGAAARPSYLTQPDGLIGQSG